MNTKRGVREINSLFLCPRKIIVEKYCQLKKVIYICSYQTLNNRTMEQEINKLIEELKEVNNETSKLLQGSHLDENNRIYFASSYNTTAKVITALETIIKNK